MKNIFLWMLFFSLPLFAQVNQLDAQGKRHGLWQGTYAESGRIRYEGKFEHGLETGIFTYYDDTKAKSVIATRDFSKEPNAAWTVYYDQQKNIVSHGLLRNKVPSGQWVYFHKASKDTKTVENYVDGKLDGIRKDYNRNGQLAESAAYKKGVLHGPYRKFSEKGAAMEEVEYVNGLIEGPAIYRDGTGQISSKGTYKAGRKDGVWEIYQKGKLLKKEKHPLVRKFAKRPAKKP